MDEIMTQLYWVWGPWKFYGVLKHCFIEHAD